MSRTITFPLLPSITVEAVHELAEILEELADGGTVALDNFGDNADATMADDQAVVLYDLVVALKEVRS